MRVEKVKGGVESEEQPTIEKIKADLAEKLARGEIDGVEYNRRITELVIPKEDSVSLRRKTYKKGRLRATIFLVIVLVVAAIPAAIYMNWRFYFQNDLSIRDMPDYSEDFGSSIDNDPIQIDFEEYYLRNGEYRGRSIDITYKAYYDITGIVTSVRDYWGFGAYDALVPRDVCMVWGSAIDAYNSHSLEFSQGERNCKPRIDGVDVYNDLDADYVKGKWGNTMYALHDFSNNHIISSTPEIRDQVFGLSVGDKVRMVGYLVKVSYDGITLDSSTSREDSGDHACEVFYVTKIEKQE